MCCELGLLGQYAVAQPLAPPPPWPNEGPSDVNKSLDGLTYPG